jgi:hypothetical protein
VYYFFPVVVVIRYETTATARWALPFIVRAFFDDTITVAVWTGFHGFASWDACPYRKSNPYVLMVQPSKNGRHLDAPGALNEPSNRRILT